MVAIRYLGFWSFGDARKWCYDESFISLTSVCCSCLCDVAVDDDDDDDDVVVE